MSTGQPEERKFDVVKFILLVMIGGVVFLLPYMRLIYYDEFLEFLNLTPLQFGAVLASYGTASTIGTFFSGILADRYSHKWLLVISVFVTGLGGLFLLTQPSYYAFLGIYLLWGLSITFTYNSAFNKSIRYTGNASQQGKLFGSINGTRKLLTWLAAFGGAGVFAYFSTESRIEGFTRVIWYYSLLYLVTGILIIFLWKKDKPLADEEKWKIKDSIAVFKHPATWFLGFIIYGVYTMSRCTDLVSPYMTQVLQIPPATSAFLNTIRLYVFPFIGGILIGYLLDRFQNKIRVCQISVAIACILFVVITTIPTQGEVWHMVFFWVLGVSIIAFWGIYGTIFSLMETINIPKKITGSIIGVAISIGYLPDITINYLSNYLADTYGFEQATHYVLITGAVHGIIAIILFYFFNKYLIRLKGAETEPQKKAV